MPDFKRITVIGAGNIGAALIGGMLQAGVSDAHHLTATTRSPEKAQALAARFHIAATAGGSTTTPCSRASRTIWAGA